MPAHKKMQIVGGISADIKEFGHQVTELVASGGEEEWMQK